MRRDRDLLPLLVLATYLGAYACSTEIFHGRWGNEKYRIRVFRSAWHQNMFTPLLLLERGLSPVQPQFYGQVRNGASLPPPAEEGNGE